MRRRSGGISGGRLPRDGIVRRPAMLAVAAVTAAALTTAGLVAWRNRAAPNPTADGHHEPEVAPGRQTAADPSTAGANHAYGDLLAEGDAFGLQGDFDAAIGRYTRAIELDPQAADAYAKRASALASNGATKMAIGDYDFAIRRAPSDPKLYLSRAQLQLARKRADLALADCDAAVRLAPKLVDARLYRGNVHLGLGEFDAAIVDYDFALAIMPTSASAYCDRGIAYRSKREFDRAIADYTSAIRYNTSFAEAYNDRGEAYLRQSKYDQAMADFNQALHINPSEYDAHDNRGDLFLLLDKPGPAIADYTHIIDRVRQMAAKSGQHPSLRTADIYRKRATAHLHANQPDEAIADAGEAIRINPDDAGAHAVRRDAYRKLGNKWSKTAEADDEAARRLQPSSPSRAAP